MNQALLFFLVVLGVLVAYSSARPLTFVVNQINTTTGYVGLGMAWGTHVQGKNNYRLRIFGLHNINNKNDTVTGAYLVTATAVLQKIKISPSGGQYFVGDVRFNTTVWTWLLQEMVGITVTTQKFPSIAISGAFISRVNLAFTILSAAQVVPSSSFGTGIGMGMSYIYNSFNMSGIDLLALDTAFSASYSYLGLMVYNVPNATNATFNAPAGPAQTAAPLVNFITQPTFALSLANTTVTSTFFSQAGIRSNAYLQVTSPQFPNGAIRGNLVPLVVFVHRRHVPSSVSQVYGQTVAPLGFATLSRQNQKKAFSLHRAAFITLQTTQQTPGSGNYTYQGIFNFRAGTRRQNLGSIRALLVELNIRLSGGQGFWVFEWYNAVTAQFVPGATFSPSARSWTLGFLPYYDAKTAWQLSSGRAVTQIRVSGTSATPSKLLVDLFGLRSASPSAAVNSIVKTIVQTLPALPTQ